MSASGITPFLCETIDKGLVRSEWERWLRAFNIYIAAEDIKDPVRKRNKLLHLGGLQLQEVVYNIPGALVDPATEDVDGFQVLVEKLTEYFSPKRNSTFERHLFRSLKPDEGESLSKFILRLRNQATKCQFGATKEEVVEINIKDKLIDVWASKDLKKRLLEKEHGLAEIIEMCQVYEQINNQSESMISAPFFGINEISSGKRKGKTESECSRCGRRGHAANSTFCPATSAKCNKCNLRGHFARMCRTKSNKRRFDDVEERKTKGVRLVTDETKSESDSEKLKEYDCFKITAVRDPKNDMSEIIECFVGGHKISMLIDSGSRHNLLSENDWEYLRNRKAIMWNIRTKSEEQFRAYAGNDFLKIKIVFQAVIGIDKNSNAISSFYVIENGRQSLLSRDTAIKLKVLKLGWEANQVEETTHFPKIRE